MNEIFPVGSLVEIKATGVRLIVLARMVGDEHDHKGEQLLSSDPVAGTGEWYRDDELELIRAPAESNIFVADADEIEPEVEESFQDFWAELVMKDGMFDLVQIKRELHDYSILLENVPKVYDYITGGAISKPHTSAASVIDVAEGYIQRLMEIEKRERGGQEQGAGAGEAWDVKSNECL